MRYYRMYHIFLVKIVLWLQPLRNRFLSLLRNVDDDGDDDDGDEEDRDRDR